MNIFKQVAWAVLDIYDTSVDALKRFGPPVLKSVAIAAILSGTFVLGAYMNSRVSIEDHPTWRGYPGVQDEPIVVNPGARIPVILDPQLNASFYAWYTDQGSIMVNPSYGTDRLVATLIHEWGHHLALTSIREGWSEEDREALAHLIYRCLHDINQDIPPELVGMIDTNLFIAITFEDWEHFFVSDARVLNQLPESVRQLVRDEDLAEEERRRVLLDLLEIHEVEIAPALRHQGCDHD